jgi:hypothetical protein
MLRFEANGANAARDFLRKYGVPESSIDLWIGGSEGRQTPRQPVIRNGMACLDRKHAAF